jgi:phosphomannomutase
VRIKPHLLQNDWLTQKSSDRTNGEWITFTGDQLGALFASWTLEIYKASGKPLNKLAMVASTVSSKMIEAMAQAEGFKFVECLTGQFFVPSLPHTLTISFTPGFKFIGNTALTLVEQGLEVPFGYEEAIGFMFGSEIRDKDGVAATVCISLSPILSAI